MNTVLERIIETQQVSDGTCNLPLRHPDFPDLPVAVTRAEGELIQRIIAEIKPRTTLEIGCAYGVSTLYICEALASLPDARRSHIVLDPFQSTQWRGIGIRNARDAGFADLIDFREQRVGARAARARPPAAFPFNVRWWMGGTPSTRSWSSSTT